MEESMAQTVAQRLITHVVTLNGPNPKYEVLHVND